jgi:hypothetical protein
MYHVTLVNLAPDARSADVYLGASKSRTCSAAELGALLNVFRELDPLQNVEADPEIRIHHRSSRYTVRTGQGRLLFSDANDSTQPTLVLSVAEILAELDGSAAAARTRAPFSIAERPELGAAVQEVPKVAVAAASAKHRVRLVALSVATVLLLAANVGLLWLRGSAPEPELTPLDSVELAAAVPTFEGVYVTGSEPGARGIVVGGEGTIRIFELNAGGAPSFVHGTWKAGRFENKLSLLVPQLRTIITIVDRETLLYGGERYRRATTL